MAATSGEHWAGVACACYSCCSIAGVCVSFCVRWLSCRLMVLLLLLYWLWDAQYGGPAAEAKFLQQCPVPGLAIDRCGFCTQTLPWLLHHIVGVFEGWVRCMHGRMLIPITYGMRPRDNTR